MKYNIKHFLTTLIICSLFIGYAIIDYRYFTEYPCDREFINGIVTYKNKNQALSRLYQDWFGFLIISIVMGFIDEDQNSKSTEKTIKEVNE